MLLYFCTEFPEIRRENALCVAGCYRHDIAANSRRQNRDEFALCVSRHLLKALLKNGLKILLKKYQLFKTILHYMGNEIFIQNRKVCVQPLRNRLEAIQRLQTSTTVKGCRRFVGMVNFLSMFCPELQKLLKQIYDLTRKGRLFIWGKEQQDSFEEIKHRLIKPPVLDMPKKDREIPFIL